jgi:hypothetical protein
MGWENSKFQKSEGDIRKDGLWLSDHYAPWKVQCGLHGRGAASIKELFCVKCFPGCLVSTSRLL